MVNATNNIKPCGKEVFGVVLNESIFKE